MNLKIKLVCGYRHDQEHSIDSNEAHKAYYLFLNPEKRGVFSNGLAIVGSDIKQILPDYMGTMNFNPTYKMESEDWDDVRKFGIDRKLRGALTAGKEVATLGRAEDMNRPLDQLIQDKYPHILGADEPRKYVRGESISNLLPPTEGV